MPPTTRCKFRCMSVESFGPGAGVKVNLSAIYPSESDGYKHSAEDHAFFSATPSGTLSMHIQNPYGAELFEPGKNFYLDISEAKEPSQS